MAESETTIQVTKINAVHRQIDPAIRMWFADDDPVAIHTLVAAAHELLHTLFKRAGLAGLLFDSPSIKKEWRSTVAKAIKAPATFFKHAQRDPDATLTFHPGVNETILLYCASALDRMNEAKSIEVIALAWWLWLREPELFLPEAGHHNVPANLFDYLRKVNKFQFLEVCRDLAKISRLPGYTAR
ncbi:MAG TPA: hypothetical protein VMQ99_11575 [Acetobacteraceae bacterium]|jgi:hypothetical protein|nr:hypothetical protein [Acetobacteraceae bacterium]